MSESQFSMAGILFLISLLCACGSKPSFDALTSAQTAGSDQSAQNGNSKGKGKGSDEADQSKSSDQEDGEECSTEKSSVVAVCHVDSDNETHQVCTDTVTAKTKYGLEASKPNQAGTNGVDHLGAC